MESSLYVGSVRHQRKSPTRNAFSSRLMYVGLNLDEIDEVFSGRWLWSTRRWAPIRFKRSDYLGPCDIDLKSAVLDCAESRLGRRPSGPVMLLTHLRHFGYCFNPVSFYYIYEGGRLDVILAQITNTPWGERHTYCLDFSAADSLSIGRIFKFQKTFHVSPFIPMNVLYEWRFSEPGETISVHMRDNVDSVNVFEATLALHRRPITSANLAHALLAFPFMTFKVVLLIHWQAFRLWLKRVPFFNHPESSV
jgi:hypothetical protein